MGRQAALAGGGDPRPAIVAIGEQALCSAVLSRRSRPSTSAAGWRSVASLVRSGAPGSCPGRPDDPDRLRDPCRNLDDATLTKGDVMVLDNLGLHNSAKAAHELGQAALN
jgi:hypothetical protein